MKTTLVSKENNEAKLTMEFTAEEFDAACNDAYKKSRNQFMIDGFRKGKAPRSIIEKHYGEGVFFEDAINTLFQNHYADAVKELELDVIDSPRVDFSEIAKGQPLTMTLDVALFPIVEVKDYMGAEVDQFDDHATDEDVDRQIEALQKRNARMIAVERPVEDGDTVILDYAGFVGEEQFQGGTAERQELKIGSGMFIPGFEEQLVGANAGDKVDVNVTFPEEYGEASLAGKDAVFHCEIHEIKAEDLPELDDEFAKDVSEFDTLEELKAQTREDIEKSKVEAAAAAAKDNLVNKIYAANDIDVPRALVEEEIDQMAQELDQQLRYQGLSLEQYIQFTGKDMAGFREDVREDAEKRAGSRVMVLSIADAENVEVSDADVDEELSNMAQMYGMELDQIKQAVGDNVDFLKKDIRVKKTIDMLYDNAKVNLVATLAPEAEEENEEKAEADAE